MITKNQINIFIVEDNKVFTMALKADIENTFKGVSIKIQTFETGETCMQQFNQEKPQVVILDYHLNGKYPDAADGIKVLEWIKKENPETSVIILTGEDRVDIAVQSFKHGASDYVVKTETKFKKINSSLMNIFKIIETKRDAKKYMNVAIVFFLCIVLLVGGIIAIQLKAPSLLNI